MDVGQGGCSSGFLSLGPRGSYPNIWVTVRQKGFEWISDLSRSQVWHTWDLLWWNFNVRLVSAGPSACMSSN